MSWEARNGEGAYYTRSKRSGGRIVREYVGSGDFARVVAEMDDLERQQRKAEGVAQREERARLNAIDAQVARLDRLADLVARAVLVDAGYHQHNRGEWRKRRGTKIDEEKADP